MIDRWKNLIECLPPGLSFGEAARRLGLPYQQVRRAIFVYKYSAIDGRRFSQNGKRKFNPYTADWRKSNIALSRESGVSRERIRFLREKLGKPFVEARGRHKKVNHARR